MAVKDAGKTGLKERKGALNKNLFLLFFALQIENFSLKYILRYYSVL